MSTNSENLQNPTPQVREDEKEIVKPTNEPLFNTAQVQELMKAQMEAFINTLGTSSPLQKNEYVNKYEEYLRNRVVNTQSNLIQPAESQKPRVNALDYVNSVLDSEKEYRNSMENGRMATQHNTRIEHLKDKIYILSEFPENTRERIAEILKDEIEEIA